MGPDPKILKDLRSIESYTWQPSPFSDSRIELPPMLPLGDGNYIYVTENILKLISKYSHIYWENSRECKSSFKKHEIEKLSTQIFAKILSEVDLRRTDDELCKNIIDEFNNKFKSEVCSFNKASYLTLGCHLLEGDVNYPIKIGPVVFERREQWLTRLREEGHISPIAERRVKNTWLGKKYKPRKLSKDSIFENGIIDTLGTRPITCTIETRNLSSIYIEEKGLLAARLAITALSLMWHLPSRALEFMRLTYDKNLHHQHSIIYDSDRDKINILQPFHPRCGYRANETIKEIIKSYRLIFDQIGIALFNYVQPTIETSHKLYSINHLFLSLWWFHEACREPSDQIATTKFAASMDSLTGGKQANGIIEFIEEHVGFKRKDPFTKDGSTIQQIIDNIYNKKRSQFIHGSSKNFNQDWSESRTKSELLSRICIIKYCQWQSNIELSNARLLDNSLASTG